MPRTPDFFYRSHAAARFVFGAGFFSAAVFSRQPIMALLQCLLACLVLRWLHGDWKTVTRGWRLLRWLLIPIVLLHLLFTPGEVLLTRFPLRFSSEGLHRGLWLSLHLATIFYAALVLARMWRYEEWLGYIHIIAGRRMAAHLLLLFPLWRDIQALIRVYQRQWRLRGSLSMLGQAALGLARATIRQGRARAGALWLRWHDDMHLVLAGPTQAVEMSTATSVIWMLFGIAWIVSIWLQ